MNERERIQLTPELVTRNAARIISPELLNDIEHDGIAEGGRECSREEMVALQEEIFEMQAAFDKENLNPYHNAPHGREVTERLEKLLGKLRLPGWRADALRLAAPHHDIGHSGKTIRQAPDGLSNEEFAAVTADTFAKENGFSVFQRILIQGEVIGTTFGNPDVSPQTHEEETLAIADLAGFSKSWDEWIEESAHVLAEVDPENRPKTIDEWLEGQHKFLAWIDTRMTAEARGIWGTDLALQRQTVETIVSKPDHARRRIVDELITPLLRQA